ncbi:MAG: HD domain-containing protein [Deltaproteobacteria bacterium]|nr:MAG: HD domain-containing protein [Deltaproteobacteria bacterium]
MEPIAFPDDPLSGLAETTTFGARLALVHAELRRRCPGVARMAVALHDRATGLLKTFAASPAGESPLRNYEVSIVEAASLRAAAVARRPRVVHDLEIFAAGTREHSRRILGHGFASSYTLPVFEGGELIAFVFCNSLHKGYFRNGVLAEVDVFAHLAAQLVIADRATLRTLNAALRTMVGMVHVRDPETGNHLERMARYARLIARELVSRGKCGFDDEQIEQLFNFSPLHDIGKLGIPDSILLKPGKLGADERTVMDTHPLVGRRMIDALVENFGFQQIPYVASLKALVEYHHEKLDGNGYPHGLKGDEIPLEARIVAVSDVFDALTTSRPYKGSWPNQHALAMLQLLAIDQLDSDCVTVLLDCPEEVAAIQQRFADAA